MEVNKKSFVGKVVRDKMDKSIVVAIPLRRLHPLYKKYISRTKKLMVHDEKNEAHVGDTVRITECRPISRHKSWRLLEIVDRAK